PVINFQYTIGKIIFAALSDDKRIARTEPSLNYGYKKQRISIRRIENISRSLLIKEDDGRQRIMSFGEFLDRIEQNANNSSNKFHTQSFEKLSKRLLGLTPYNKPVLWRVITLQACLYHALYNSSKPEYQKYFQKSKSTNRKLNSEQLTDILNVKYLLHHLSIQSPIIPSDTITSKNLEAVELYLNERTKEFGIVAHTEDYSKHRVLRTRTLH
ncbi:MAG TPA: hypothetical protein VKA95_02595, partial [Nitrososphaeraceae archaeon]|nr:hypothetical protein [Nitrososphaeraceae archaeon]